ncbi:NAD(P)H-binding protein [Streptomyces sp. YU58]|uniref:NAD(P)H-binding protein n=1 Tax=Streptomyces sp. SX92 TaxID=3158972 RepID=UPI0027BA2A07|nr:NAD(P)H-binding protein [Streptomyces coralus]WLW56999.1 NAD(P)H-binding protein [Streptomyces coralus]
MSRILVIGASGKTGRHVVAGLVSRGATVRAASRNPEQLDVTGADTERFDWHDESTWGPALDGVDGVYLVKPESADVVKVVGRFLDAVKAVRATRLVFLSECAAQTRPGDVTERQVELAVESSDLEWTILRPSWFMQDIVDEYFFGPMVRDDRIIVMTTGGSATAWIDARDIAEVAAEVLVNGGAAGQALDLTGPDALTLDQLAERITAVADSPVTGVEESLREAETRMRADGLDEGFVAYMTRIAESIIAGETATVTGEVERVTGRPPRDIDAFLAEQAGQLRPSGKARAEMDAEQTLQRARDNEALFRRLISAWARTDLDDLIDCFADDMVYTDMPFPGEPVRGKAAFREHVKRYNALFADGQVEVEFVTLVATSTNVVGELLCRARYVGPGAPEGGVPVRWYATLVDTVMDGRVVSEHVYFDPTAFDKAVARAA